MQHHRLLPVLLPVLLLVGGCSEAVDTASRARDCAGLATDVARSGLGGVPTQAEAEQAVQRLEDRIDQLESTAVKKAATTLRDRLRDLQQAAGTADRAAVTKAAEGARTAARDAAQACGLPAEQFVG